MHMWQTFPNWHVAIPETTRLSSGQLFCVFDLFLTTYSMLVIVYIERARNKSFNGETSKWQVFANMLAGGPGFAFALELVTLCKSQPSRRSLNVAKNKRPAK